MNLLDIINEYHTPNNRESFIRTTEEVYNYLGIKYEVNEGYPTSSPRFLKDGYKYTNPIYNNKLVKNVTCVRLNFLYTRIASSDNGYNLNNYNNVLRKILDVYERSNKENYVNVKTYLNSVYLFTHLSSINDNDIRSKSKDYTLHTSRGIMKLLTKYLGDSLVLTYIDRVYIKDLDKEKRMDFCVFFNSINDYGLTHDSSFFDAILTNSHEDFLFIKNTKVSNHYNKNNIPSDTMREINSIVRNNKLKNILNN